MNNNNNNINNQTNQNNQNNQSFNDQALGVAIMTKAGGLITRELIRKGEEIAKELYPSNINSSK